MATSRTSARNWIAIARAEHARIVQPGEPYIADMGNGVLPWRRDVRYVAGQEAQIANAMQVDAASLQLNSGER